MPPNTQQTVKRYTDAFAYAPAPGFPSRWAPGTGPKRTNFTRNFHGPVPMMHHQRRATGLGDGEGLGGVFDDIVNAGKGAASAALAPVTDKANQLEGAIKLILLFSGIAATTGVVNLLRR